MIAGNLRWMKSALLGRSRHRPKVLISSIRTSKNFFRANLIDSSNFESPSGGNRRAMRHEPARPDQLAHSAGACRCRQRARVGGLREKGGKRHATVPSQPPRNTSSAISTALPGPAMRAEPIISNRKAVSDTSAGSSACQRKTGQGPASASDSVEPGQVRTRLSAGGRWIRTSGSGASGEADAILPVKDRPR